MKNIMKAMLRVLSTLAVLWLVFAMVPAGAFVSADDVLLSSFTVTVQGDSSVSSNVEGAEVTLTAGDRDPVTAITDEEGKAVFSIAEENAVVRGANYNYTVKAAGYATVRSEAVGETLTARYYGANIIDISDYLDSEAPVINSVSKDPDTAWTKGSVEITVNAEDNFEIESYNFDGSDKWQEENTYKVEENCTLTIRVKDSAGNIASQQLVISNIDKSVPVINNVLLTPSSETSENVTIEVVAHKDRVGAVLSYSFDGGETWGLSKLLESDKNQVFSAGKIMVKDDVGNEISYINEVRVDKINKASPVIDSIEFDVVELTNGAVTITVNASCDFTEGYNGSKDLFYRFGSDKEWQTDNRFVVTENQTFDAGEIQVRTVAWNITESGSSVAVENIDTDPPSIEDIEVMNSDGEVGGWDAESNTVSFCVPKESIKKVWFQTTNSAVDSSAAALTATDSIYSFKVTENGTYYLYALDVAGNLREAVPVYVNTIDKTAPVLYSPIKNPNTEWHNGAVGINVTGTDAQTTGDTNGSGISSVVYSCEYNSYKEALENDSLLHATFDPASDSYRISTPDEAMIKTYYIWAIDGVGHISNTVSTQVKIDKNAPVNPTVSYVKDADKGFVKEVVNVLTFGLFFKDSVTVEIGAEDKESGIAKYQYQLVPVGESINEDEWIDIETKEESAEFTVPYQDFKGKLYIRVWDAAGNVTEAITDTANGSVIVMDNKSVGAPAVSVNDKLSTEWTGSWINSDAVIIVSGAEFIAGVDYYEYRIDYKDPDIENLDWTIMPETDGTVAHVEEGTVANKLTIDEDFNAELYFRAVSNTRVLGASSDVVSVKVQKSAPDNATCSLAPTNGRDMYGRDTGWYVGSYEAPNLRIIEPETNSYAAPASTYYKLWNVTLGQNEAGASEVLFTGVQPSFSADGIYGVKIWTVDAAGNSCDTDDIIVINEIKIATSAPTDLDITSAGVSLVASDQDTVVFNTFINSSFKIDLEAKFGISGTGSLYYQKVRTAAQYNPTGSWTPYNKADKISVEPGDKFIIYLRAEDSAGNYTIVHTNGIILDDQPPEVEFGAPELSIAAPSPAKENGFFNGDVLVKLSAEDPRYQGSVRDDVNGTYSGLSSVTYRIIADGVETKSTTVLFPISGGDYVVDEDGLIKAWSGNITVSAVDNNSNNVVVEVTAVDNAGNSRVTRTEEGAIKIDVTKPIINISYKNNQGDSQSNGKDVYFNADRVATISITERNFRAEDAVIVVTRDGVRLATVCDWQLTNPGTGNGDDRTHEAKIVYKDDGAYTFSIEYTDVAGNESEPIIYAAGTVAPERFVVDQTPPQIVVSYNNNSALNGKYFNNSRSLTITVTERNFDPARVNLTRTASLDGSSLSLQNDLKWKNLGNDKYSVTLENSRDGDYIFDVNMTDMAGNKNSSVKYGDSVAPNNFTIDTKFETLTIAGVENGRAYTNGVVPSIRFEDINFDRHEIKLTRTVWGERNVDVTRRFVPNVNLTNKGGSVTISGIEKIQENDGIYTLSVVAYDKAGNNKSANITFTINAFGSVYMFNDDLIALQDGYVNSVKTPLVITEYNPNRLVEDSLNIEITCDGVPIRDVDYTVDPEITDKVTTSNSGWYEYNYIIDPSNFVDAGGNPIDGVYKIAVSSRDEADNTPESTNYSDKIILFCIDNVAPEIVSITGLSSRVINQTSVNVGFEIFDAIGLKSVKVYVNNMEVKSFTSFDNIGSFRGSFTLGQGVNQKIRIVAEDKAGNITDTDDKNYVDRFPFERTVTVSTNFFVRWYANTPAFVGSIGSTGVVGGAIWFVMTKRTRKLFG